MQDQADDMQTGSLDDLICFAVYSTSHAFNHIYRTLLADLDLTYPQYLVMLLLWRGDDRTVKAIGQELGLESNTLTPLLKRLESMDLVTRRRDPQDERVVRTSLTPKGQRLKEKARAVPDCIIEAAGMTPDDLAALTRTLHMLADRLSKQAD